MYPFYSALSQCHSMTFAKSIFTTATTGNFRNWCNFALKARRASVDQINRYLQ